MPEIAPTPRWQGYRAARRLTTPCCCCSCSATAAQLPPCRHLEYCIFCSRDASRIVRPCSSTSSPSAVANFLQMRLVRESVSVIAQSHVAAWPLGTRKRLFSSCLRAAGEMMACGALQLTAHDGRTRSSSSLRRALTTGASTSPLKSRTRESPFQAACPIAREGTKNERVVTAINQGC